MNFTASTPVRQPAPELPDHGGAAPPSLQPRGEGEELIVYLRLLWGQRGFLIRAFIYLLVINTAIAFLIPARYESTSRLMPPDSQSASGLASAVAAVSGGAGGIGGVASELLGAKNTSAAKTISSSVRKRGSAVASL